MKLHHEMTQVERIREAEKQIDAILETVDAKWFKWNQQAHLKLGCVTIYRHHSGSPGLRGSKHDYLAFVLKNHFFTEGSRGYKMEVVCCDSNARSIEVYFDDKRTTPVFEPDTHPENIHGFCDTIVREIKNYLLKREEDRLVEIRKEINKI